jgi:hypothetical protein
LLNNGLQLHYGSWLNCWYRAKQEGRAWNPAWVQAIEEQMREPVQEVIGHDDRLLGPGAHEVDLMASIETIRGHTTAWVCGSPSSS